MFIYYDNYNVNKQIIFMLDSNIQYMQIIIKFSKKYINCYELFK